MTHVSEPGTARIHSPGLLSLVQDRGRHGHEHLGVPTSGAYDLPLHDAANALVGNDPAAATIEFVGVGPQVSFDTDVVIAVTGDAPAVTVGGAPVPARHGILVPTGQVLSCGPVHGRGYLAVTGGFTPSPVLGSRSRCVLSGLGPDPLTAGAALPVGGGPLVFGRATRQGRPDLSAVTVLPGPDLHLLSPAAVTEFTSRRWEVSAHSTRVGIRLSGALPEPPLDTLPSRGMVTGAVQVTPAGTPVLLGPDHGTTGGYPVPFVIAHSDLPRLAHLLPGHTLRFTMASADSATAPVPVLDLTAVA